MDEFLFKPIGYIRSDCRFKAQLPRQAVFSNSPAFLEFVPDGRLGEACADLRGFDRIWLLSCFHLNTLGHWKSKVRPPVSLNGGKYGVFATRSPYRPNPIGLSCVELLGVEKGGLRIGGCDLLDGTPVLDIKPYIPEVDSFPAAAAGWRDAVCDNEAYEVCACGRFAEQAAFVKAIGGGDLLEFCRVQLSMNPFDFKRKRIKAEDAAAERYLLSCRMWRLRFRVERRIHRIELLQVVSGYTPDELAEAKDEYLDKTVHRKFFEKYGVEKDENDNSRTGAEGD